MTLNQVLTLIYPTLNSLFLIFLSYIGVKLAPVIPMLFAYGKTKLGAAKEAALLAFGTKIFYRVEEDGRIGKLLKSKIDDFETYIVAKYPVITKAEVDTLRQAISGEFNKDKVASTTELQNLTATLQPIVKTVPLKVTTITNYTDPNTGEIISSKTSDDTTLNAITPSSVGTFTNGIADPLVEGVNLNTEATPIVPTEPTDTTPLIA